MSKVTRWKMAAGRERKGQHKNIQGERRAGQGCTSDYEEKKARQGEDVEQNVP
jgi:hypothetical protein